MCESENKRNNKQDVPRMKRPLLAALAQHYTGPFSRAKLVAHALQSTGAVTPTSANSATLTATTAPTTPTEEEFHLRGEQATLGLGRRSGLVDASGAGARTVLDLGSGLGGAARTLSRHFGCTVLGVDFLDEFVLAAREISHGRGFPPDRVWFEQGDMCDLDAVWRRLHDQSPLESPLGTTTDTTTATVPGFDQVWMQHVLMNVDPRDHDQLWDSIAQVLTSRRRYGGASSGSESGSDIGGGPAEECGQRLVLYEIFRGQTPWPRHGTTLPLPLPFASSMDTCHFQSFEQLNRTLESSRHFRNEYRHDATRTCIDWVLEQRKTQRSNATAAQTAQTTKLIMGQELAVQKSIHLLECLERGYLSVWEGIWRLEAVD